MAIAVETDALTPAERRALAKVGAKPRARRSVVVDKPPPGGWTDADRVKPSQGYAGHVDDAVRESGIKPPTKRQERVTAKQKAARRAAAREAAKTILADAARSMLTSEGWIAWATTRSKFHRYSLSNTFLILAQCPTATQVAGFKKWQSMGRQVMGGERGIKVYAPGTIKVENKDGEEESRSFFHLVTVFDVAQTEGEPLPEHPYQPVSGDSHKQYLTPLKAFSKKLGYAVSFEDVPGKAEGFCDAKGKRIVVSKTLAPNAQVAVLIHEIAHALGVGYEGYGRKDAEVIVETATFIVTRGIGLDTSSSSVPYVAGWGEANDLDAIKAHAKVVDDVAKQIEDAVAKVRDKK